MAYKATADFSDLLKQANAVGKQSGKLFSDNFNLAQGGMFAKSLARFKDIQKRVEKDGKDAAARIEIHKLGLAKKTHAEELKLEREAKVLKAKVAAELDKDAKKALGQQYAAKLKELKLVQSYNKDTAKFIKDMNKSVSAVQSIANITNREIKQLERATKTLKSVSEWVEENLKSGSEKWGENLTEAAEGLGDAFVSGIDVTALSKKLSAGLGKGLGKAGDLLGAAGGGGGVFGMVLKVLGGAVGVLGATVGALGALLAAFVMVDKKVKEFNKDIIKTHGALSVMRLGSGDLNKGLTIMKHTVMDLTGNLGVSEEEAKALFQSLDNGNLTLSRLTGGTSDAALAQRRLSASLRDTYAAANMTGVGLSEYADNLTNYVNDLGMSTETVNDNFRSIAKMASESGFSTRRFYSMVVQATSGQSALNVHLEQTGDLLLRMSKIMGMKKAAEMVGGAAGDMGSMGATERIKTLLIAGGRGQRVFSREATQQAKNFAQDRAGMTSAFTKALETAGLTGRGLESAFASGATDPQELVNRLGALNAQDQRALLSGLRASGEPGAEDMARQLESLVNLSRGARGGLSQRVGSMQELSAGGSMAMRAAMVQRIVGNRTAGELSAPERAAAESVSGMSGHQMDAFISQIKAQQGDFETMIRLGGRTDEASRATVKRLADLYHVTVSNGRILDESNRELRDGNDLFQTNASSSSAVLEKTRDESTQLAYQTMDATVSIADILENKVAQYIQQVYEVLAKQLLPLLYKLPWLKEGAEAYQNQQTVADGISKTIEEIGKRQSERARQIGQVEVTSRSGATPEERAAAKQQLQNLRQAQDNDAARINALRAGRGRVLSGEQAVTQTTTVSNTADQNLLDDPGVMNRIIGAVVNRVSPTSQVTRTLSTNEVTAQILRQAGVAGPTNGELSGFGTVRPATGSTTSVPGTAAPTATPTPSPPTQAHAEAATAPVVDAQQESQEHATQISQKEMREARARERREAANAEKLVKSRSLGDSLAQSNLPDAIAEADAKMRVLEGIYEKGPVNLGNEVVNRLLSGTASESDFAAAGTGGAAARALRYRHATQDPGVHDFISQDRGGRTVITPIDRADQVMGMKPGGPMANAGSRVGGNVNISIHGGDERRVFNVVRRAIQQAGITPNRVPGG